MVAPDPKHSLPTESRHIAVGRVDGRPMFVAFAIRGPHSTDQCPLHAREGDDEL